MRVKFTHTIWTTFGGTLWGPGIAREEKGGGDPKAFGRGWLHFYDDVGGQFGCTKLTTVRVIPQPRVDPFGVMPPISPLR